MPGQRPHHPHDRSHRLLFSHPEMIRDLLSGFVKEPWVDELDFTAMRQLPTNYVTGELGDLDERIGDVVWEIKWKESTNRRPLYVFIVLEFQSTSEELMALRMLVYVGLFYQRLLKERPLEPGEKLPPVFPLVHYNGEEDYKAPLNVAELIAAPEALRRYVPSMEYFLLDQRRTPAAELAGWRNLVAGLFRLEQSESPGDVGRVLEDLLTWLDAPSQTDLRRDFALWLRSVLLPSRVPGADIPEAGDLDRFKTLLEEKVQTWTEQWRMEGFEAGRQAGWQEGRQEGIQKGIRKGRQEGRKEGIQKGRQEGEAAMLIRQAERKFGSLDASLRARIRKADADQLLVWGERLVTADRLSEVFSRDS